MVALVVSRPLGYRPHMRRLLIMFVILALAGSGMVHAMHDAHDHHAQEMTTTADHGAEKPCDLCALPILATASASSHLWPFERIDRSAIAGPRSVVPLDPLILRRDRPPR